MTTSKINSILNDINNIKESYSLGFKRYFVLPNRYKKNIGLAYLIKFNKTDHHNYTVSFFSDMSNSEYRNYLKSL